MEVPQLSCLSEDKGEPKMYEEVKLGAEMHKFEIGVPVEGILKEKRTEVGKNESNVYTVGDKTFWGTSALDLLMSGIKEGAKSVKDNLN